MSSEKDMQQLTIHESSVLPVRREPSAGDLLSLMIEKSGGALTMETAQAFKELVQLKREEEDRYAAKEFANAMAAFQEECPIIEKNTNSQKATTGGSSFGFKYASLDEISRTIKSLMAKHGLSFSWDSVTAEKSVEVICVVTHINGHQIRRSVKGPGDNSLPKGNAAQQHGSALSYYMRYALVLALGLTSCIPDTDGNPPPDTSPITKEQVATLQALLDEIGIDSKRLLKYTGVQKLSDIPISRFADAVTQLEKLRAKK